MKILGISAFYHDSAAALINDGHIIAAVQEERFTRSKHDAGFPHNAVRFCLEKAGCGPDAVDLIVFYEKPLLKFERLLETYLSFAPRGFESFRLSIPQWIKEKLFQKDMLRKKLASLDPTHDWGGKLLFAEHHRSHAASAFFPSPFDEALVLTLDGVGEWATASAAIGSGNSLETIKEIHFPHSLGLLYSAFTYYTGFKVNSGEYKLMGLAPYGKPRFAGTIREHLMDIKPDGSFRLNMRYFDYCAGLRMTGERFHALFGRPPRKPTEPIEQIHMDLAASVQAVTEEVMLKLAKALRKETGQKNLCLAGGVALNCTANGKLLKERIFDRIWIQPAAGDAGGALGAALSGYYTHKRMPRAAVRGDSMQGSYLGPEFGQEEIERQLTEARAVYRVLPESQMLDATAEALAKENVVGWFQGRMEFGPRALGARSILGDPRGAAMQKTMNLKIKFRESFRPFAPSVLREDVTQWFGLDEDSPYMLFVADVLPGRHIPAVTHVDRSARVQTVCRDTNPLYHALISRFRQKTGCPVLINTSFNVRGEPLVCTPRDAFRCFMGSGMDMLVIGRCVLEKEEQDKSLLLDYKNTFEPD